MIVQVNKELLSALEDCDDCIGKVFLELAPYLKFYSTYANDFEAAVKLVERWTAKSKAFRTLLANQESRPEVQLKLNSLLITPIQRIPRFANFFLPWKKEYYITPASAGYSNRKLFGLGFQFKAHTFYHAVAYRGVARSCLLQSGKLSLACFAL